MVLEVLVLNLLMKIFENTQSMFEEYYKKTVVNKFYRGVIKGDLVHDAVSYLPGRPGKPGGPGGPGGPGIPEAPPELNCPEAENKSTQSNERL